MLRGSSEDYQLRGTARSSLGDRVEVAEVTKVHAFGIEHPWNKNDDVKESVRATERSSRSLVYERA